jgi:hypothetical protein
MRKVFLSGIISGVLATTALGSGALASANGQVQLMQPSSGWAVSRIASDNTKAPFCAMARKFSDNMILTFARNAKNELSIAVDFQREALNTSQTYFTVLKPGYSQDRAFNVRPVSTKALVVRMGKDKDFFDALLRSERLNFDLDGEQYSFVMPEMASGLHDVEDCLSSVIDTPSSGQDNPPDEVAEDNTQPADEPSVAPPVRVSSAAADIDDVPVQDDPSVEALRNQNQKLKNDLDRSRKSFQDTVAAAKQVGATDKASELNVRMLQLEAQNDDLRRQLALTTAAKAVPETQVSTLRTENETLKAKVAAAEAAAQAKVAALSTENATLKQKVATPDPVVQQQLATLQSENVALKTKVSAPDPVVVQQIASLKDENIRLKTKAEAADPAAKAEVASLTTENAQLKQQLETLRSHMQSIASIPPAVDGKDQATIARLTARIDALQAENTDLGKSLSQTQAAAVNDGTVVTLAQVRAAEAQLEAVKADRDRLARQIEDYRTGKEDKLLAAAGKDWNLQQATQRYTESQREIERLGRQIEDERAKFERDKKEIEYTLFDPRIASKEQIAKMAETEGKLRQAKAELAKHNDELAKQRKDYDDKLAALKKDADAKQLKLAAVQTEMETMRKQYEARLTTVAADSSQLIDLKAQLAAKQNQLSLIDAQAKQAKTDLNQKQADASKDIATKDKALKDAKAAINALETKAADTHKQAQAAAKVKQPFGPERAPARADAAATDARTLAEASPAAGDATISTLPDVKAEAPPEPLKAVDAGKVVKAMPDNYGPPPVAPHAEAKAASPKTEIAWNNPAPPPGQPVVSEAEKMESIERVPLALPPPSSLRSLPAPEESVIDSIKPSAAAAPARSIPVPSADADGKPAAKPVNFVNASTMQSMLTGAGVKLSRDVQKVTKASNAETLALSWETGSLFGSAEERALASPSQFDAYVQSYLDKTKSRCKGDFAAVPGPTHREGDTQTATYEIACVASGDQGASAALLFYAHDGVFSTIAHEAGVDGMDVAMDIRDRLAASLNSSKVASR